MRDIILVIEVACYLTLIWVIVTAMMPLITRDPSCPDLGMIACVNHEE